MLHILQLITFCSFQDIWPNISKPQLSHSEQFLMNLISIFLFSWKKKNFY